MISIIRSVVFALLAVAVAATAVAGRGSKTFGYAEWRAEVVRIGLDPDDVVFPFGVTPEMVAWAESTLSLLERNDSGLQLKRLQEAMFEDGAFNFAYEEERTLTAQEAFQTRRGNCMSFTALFIALSRSVGVPAFLMSIRRVPEVGREDGLVVINRHVVAGIRSGGDVTTFDFNLSSEARLMSRQTINDIQASAMYHNNLGGAAIRAQDYSTALLHLGLTTRLWPEWPVGWVNLGVTLVRLDEIEPAFEAYHRALAVDPGNSSALNNMAYLYGLLGRPAEARNARLAAAKTTDNPFALVAMADSEMMRGHTKEAARYLRRAKLQYAKEPEVYEGLARLAVLKGEHARAEKRLRKAAKLRSTAETDR